MRGSKSYTVDETETARREGVRHDITDFYIHGLDSEMLVY